MIIKLHYKFLLGLLSSLALWLDVEQSQHLLASPGLPPQVLQVSGEQAGCDLLVVQRFAPVQAGHCKHGVASVEPVLDKTVQ